MQVYSRFFVKELNCIIDKRRRFFSSKSYKTFCNVYLATVWMLHIAFIAKREDRYHFLPGMKLNIRPIQKCTRLPPNCQYKTDSLRILIWYIGYIKLNLEKHRTACFNKNYINILTKLLFAVFINPVLSLAKSLLSTSDPVLSAVRVYLLTFKTRR